MNKRHLTVWDERKAFLALWDNMVKCWLAVEAAPSAATLDAYKRSTWLFFFLAPSTELAYSVASGH